MDRFPKIKSQREVDREERRGRIRAFIADCVGGCAIFILALLAMYAPEWWPMLAGLLR